MKYIGEVPDLLDIVQVCDLVLPLYQVLPLHNCQQICLETEGGDTEISLNKYQRPLTLTSKTYFYNFLAQGRGHNHEPPKFHF